MKLTYNVGSILSVLGFIVFGTLWGLSTYQWHDGSEGTWMAWAVVLGLFSVGLLFIRSLVYDKQNRELLMQYNWFERLLFFLGALCIGAAVITGCAIPLVNISTYIIQIGLGIFT